MADEQKDKGKGHGLMPSQSILDWLTHRVGDWLLGRLDTKHEQKVAGKLPQHIFGEAMTKLKIKNRNAYDKVHHFLTVHFTDPVTGEIDKASQKQFVENAAHVGGQDDVDRTVVFLEQLAELPDHDARELTLTAMGYIGPRSQSMKERAISTLTTLGSTATQTAKAELDAAIKGINDMVPGATDADKAAHVEQKTADGLKRSQDFLTRAKAKL